MTGVQHKDRLFGLSRRDEDIGDVCGVGDYSPRRLSQGFLSYYRHASIGSCNNCTHLRSDPASRRFNTTNQICSARKSMASPECCQFLNYCLNSGGVDLFDSEREVTAERRNFMSCAVVAAFEKLTFDGSSGVKVA